MIANHLEQHDRRFDVIALDGEADERLGDVRLSIGNVEGILRAMERFGTSHVVLAGWVRRRPVLRESRIGRRAIQAFLPLLRA